MSKSKAALLILILVLLVLIYTTGAYEYFSLKTIQKNLILIHDFNNKYPYKTVLIFFGSFVLMTSLSIPGAIVLTLLSGTIFGIWNGLIIVSLANCTGATIAFCLSRYLFRDAVEKKYRKKFKNLNEKFQSKGHTYLFSLRMIPVSPFVVINLLMGLTKIKVWTFIWITFIGMMPGTLVYIYAGRRITEITSPADILTWPLALILTFLGILPVVLKKLNEVRDLRHLEENL